jgi:hypothetical protein
LYGVVSGEEDHEGHGTVQRAQRMDEPSAQRDG